MRTGAIETGTIDLVIDQQDLHPMSVFAAIYIGKELATLLTMLLTSYGIVQRHDPIMFGRFQLSNTYATLLGSLNWVSTLSHVALLSINGVIYNVRCLLKSHR
jgi:hypothetical protein